MPTFLHYNNANKLSFAETGQNGMLLALACQKRLAFDFQRLW
jgi:hypothetical protein